MATRIQVLLARRSTGLAPIYAALLVLVFASLLLFAVAYWHSGPAPQSGSPRASEAGAIRQPINAEPGILRDARRPPSRGTWM